MRSNRYLKETVILIFALFIYTLLANNLQAQNKKYSEKDIPKIVLESFKQSYPNAEVIGYDVGKEKGILTYEIETKEGKFFRDIEFTADGKISEVGEIIEINTLPANIVTSINNKYKSAKILEAEKKTSGLEISYEVIVGLKSKKYEVLLDQNGKIIKESDEENEKEDDDDK
ncbi:MAG: PepSY-like domain-containing protein [Ignavibacteria bacterium]